MAYVLPGTTKASRAKVNWQLGVVVVAGAAVSLFLGVYASRHPPAGQPTFGFSPGSMLAFKSWMTTLAVFFAVLQLLSALRLRDKIRWPATVPPWLTDAHRIVGTLALVSSLPVAYHCLWSLGFRFADQPLRSPRVLIHAAAGAFFYGVFVTKMLAVRITSVPRWLVPVAGGLVFTALMTVWFSSAVYFFTGQLGG
ncbi:MAG: hypothetical protein HYX32_00630 [Actinobacteria bacterium]|nr:hypothetical protein [Actinomycetota bacterium]